MLATTGEFCCDIGGAIICQRFILIKKYFFSIVGGLILMRRKICQLMGKLWPKTEKYLGFFSWDTSIKKYVKHLMPKTGKVVGKLFVHINKPLLWNCVV